MPKLTNRPPAYTIHKASGRARIRFKGRDHYLPGKYGSKESREAYARLIVRLARDGEITAEVDQLESSATTIAEMLLAYNRFCKTHYQKNGRPTGETAVIGCAVRPLRDMYGRELVRDFGPKKLKLVRERMIHHLGWSRRHINAAVGRIKRAFTWAASEEQCPADVALSLRTVQGLQKGRSAAREKPAVKPVADDVVDRTIAELPPMLADAVRVQRLTGMRPGELLSMTIEAIDRSDPSCWEYRPDSHKVEHHDLNRVVFIGPRAIEVMAPRIVATGAGRLFRIERDGYRQAIARACDRAFPHPTLSGVPRAKLTPGQAADLKVWRKAHRWHPNRLRHSAATEIRKRFGLEGSQVILGHARADVSQVYAEVNVERGKDIARLVG